MYDSSDGTALIAVLKPARGEKAGNTAEARTALALTGLARNVPIKCVSVSESYIKIALGGMETSVPLRKISYVAGSKKVFLIDKNQMREALAVLIDEWKASKRKKNKLLPPKL